MSLPFAPLNSYVTAKGYTLFDEDQSQCYVDLTGKPVLQAIIHNPPAEWGQAKDAFLCVVVGFCTEVQPSESPHYQEITASEGDEFGGAYEVACFTYNSEDPTHYYFQRVATYEEAQALAVEIQHDVTPQWFHDHGYSYAGMKVPPHKGA